jgi:hypothetical protein
MKWVVLSMMSITAAGTIAGAPAAAADNVMKLCGTQYQAAKTGKTLPAGETWNQYLAQCRAAQKGGAAPVAATAPATKPMAAATPAFHNPFTRPAAAAPAPVVAKAPGTQSPAMAAAHDRQRQCGAQWKADKAAGKIPAGQTWPKYWSACNTRLKG